MKPEEILAGRTYKFRSGFDWKVIGGDSDAYRIQSEEGDEMVASAHEIAAYAVRDVTPAPESDQVEKVRQAQSEGASCGGGGGLLPCPFCGGEPSEDDWYDEGAFDDSVSHWFEIACKSCDFEMAGEDDQPELRSKWNRRAAPKPDAAEVNADLLAALKAIARQKDAIGSTADRLSTTRRIAVDAIAKVEAAQ